MPPSVKTAVPSRFPDRSDDTHDGGTRGAGSDRRLRRALAALALVAAAPAHAISAKYREQLERSGCTQLTDGITCDIHKTKAENAAAAQQADSGFGPWVGTWYVYTEYGDKIDEITVTAKTVTTRGHLVEAAKASQGKLTFRVKSSAFTLNDAFNGVWANGSQRGTLQKVL